MRSQPRRSSPVDQRSAGAVVHRIVTGLSALGLRVAAEGGHQRSQVEESDGVHGHHLSRRLGAADVPAEITAQSPVS